MLFNTIIHRNFKICFKFVVSKVISLCILLENIPIPLNIIPSPRSIVNFARRIKQIISSWNRSSSNSNKKPTGKDGQRSLNLHTGRVFRPSLMNDRRESDTFKNEKLFKRKRSVASNETLTYKRVIERIVKRFLLYYESYNGSKEKDAAYQRREIKNDITSFSMEFFHEIDSLDEMRTPLTQSMQNLNKKLREHFNLDAIKRP